MPEPTGTEWAGLMGEAGGEPGNGEPEGDIEDAMASMGEML